MRCTKARFFVVLASLALLISADRTGSAATREQIETDWIRQAEMWHPAKKPAQDKSAATSKPAAPTPLRYPTADIVARARRLAAELRRQGVETAAQQKELDEVEAQLKALPTDAPDDARKQLYFRARWAMRRLALASPLLGFE